MCERVLEERDGTISVVRIAERLRIDAAGEFPETNEPSVGIPIVLLLVFKRESEGASNYLIRITATSPAGRVTQIVETELVIGIGRGKGTDLILRFGFPVSGGGLYWIGVTAEDELLTRIPIDVVVSGPGAVGTP
jgi:hypothetical protein